MNKPSKIKLLIIPVFLFALALNALAQSNSFPNELKSFEFFGKGKLAPVSFGISKKSDIEIIFGDTCENKPCSYNDSFDVEFDYIDLDDCMTTDFSRDRLVCPLESYLGTIDKISLIPKSELQLSNFSTEQFKQHSSGQILTKSNGISVFYESFGDEYGLVYSFERNNGSTTTPPPKIVNGRLFSIKYTLSKARIEEIFKAPFRSED
jgi:hypothetical protein